MYTLTKIICSIYYHCVTSEYDNDIGAKLDVISPAQTANFPVLRRSSRVGKPRVRIYLQIHFNLFMQSIACFVILLYFVFVVKLKEMRIIYPCPNVSNIRSEA